MLIGRLGVDAELKYTQGGQAVLNMRLATTEKYKDRDGNRQEKTEWTTCTMWGPRAESLAQHLVKGKMLYVEGALSTRSWEDKDGNKRYATEVNVRELEFLGDNRGGERRSTPDEPRGMGPSQSMARQGGAHRGGWGKRGGLSLDEPDELPVPSCGGADDPLPF